MEVGSWKREVGSASEASAKKNSIREKNSSLKCRRDYLDNLKIKVYKINSEHRILNAETENFRLPSSTSNQKI